MDPLLQQLLGILGEQSPVMQDHGDINDMEYEPAGGALRNGEDEEDDGYGQGPSQSALALLGVR